MHPAALLLSGGFCVYYCFQPSLTFVQPFAAQPPVRGALILLFWEILQMFRSSFGLAVLGTSLCAFSLLTAPAFAQPTKMKWTDVTEKSSIEAEFVRMAEGAVILRKDGKEISVPLTKLSMASHLQALKAANPNAFSKAAPKATVGIQQTAESTKLLTESPLTEDLTIEQYLGTIGSELANGNGTILWHALTPEMQADVEDLVVTAVEAGGKGMMTQWRLLMKHINTLATEKEAFIFATPLVASNAKTAGDLKKGWPQVKVLVEAFTDKANWDSANFKPGAVGPWIAAFSAKVGKSFIQANEIAASAGAPVPDMDKLFTFKVESSTSDSAVVRFRYAGPAIPNPQTGQLMMQSDSPATEFVRVSGKWLPKPMVDGWKSDIAEAKVQLQAAMPSASGGLALVIPVVGSLANAKSQQEFNAVIQQLTSSMPNMGGGNGMAMGAGMGAPGAGAAPMRPSKGPAGAGVGNAVPVNPGN